MWRQVSVVAFALTVLSGQTFVDGAAEESFGSWAVWCGKTNTRESVRFVLSSAKSGQTWAALMFVNGSQGELVGQLQTTPDAATNSKMPRTQIKVFLDNVEVSPIEVMCSRAVCFSGALFPKSGSLFEGKVLALMIPTGQQTSTRFVFELQGLEKALKELDRRDLQGLACAPRL
jgi:hypothetical protein